MSGKDDFYRDPNEEAVQQLRERSRRRKVRLRKLRVDITHYRLHRSAIDELGWRRNIVVIRIGKPVLWVAAPWWHRPCVRNWRYCRPDERYPKFELKAQRPVLRNKRKVAGKLTERRRDIEFRNSRGALLCQLEG